MEQVALNDPVLLLHPADLEHLAAEADHQHAAHVGIAGVAPLSAFQRLETLALSRHAASGAVNERDNTVHVGVLVEQALLFGLAGDQARNGRRAIHRRQHPEIVTRACLAAGPAVALEGRLILDGEHVDRASVFAEAVIALKILQHAILLVNPLAGSDVAAREADDLAEFANRLAQSDRRRRHFVSARHANRRDDARRRVAWAKLLDGDQNVVGGVQAQRAGG